MSLTLVFTDTCCVWEQEEVGNTGRRKLPWHRCQQLRVDRTRAGALGQGKSGLLLDLFVRKPTGFAGELGVGCRVTLRMHGAAGKDFLWSPCL